jgi:hypothetical protein
MSNSFRRYASSFAGILLLYGCENAIDPVERTVAAPRRDVMSASTDTWPGVFDPFTVLSLYLELSTTDWDKIRKDITNTIEVPAQFYAAGETPIAVTVRRKSSRALPSESNPVKIGMKVKAVSGRWHGITTLSLENGADVGPVAEGVAWNLHEMASVDGYYGAGYHAGLASWVRVYVNGAYIGVYVNAEQRNKQFLRNRYGTTADMWFYEMDDIGQWSLEAGDPHSPTFTALCFSPFQLSSKKGAGSGSCSQPSDAQLQTLLNQYIDMQAMLTEGAVDAITNNGDALFSHGKNVNWVDFADLTRRRVYYPWDLDGVFRGLDGNIYASNTGKNKYAQSPYQSVILNHPAFRQQYNQLMLGLIAFGGPLSIENVGAFLDAAEPAVQAALNTDPYVGTYRSGQFASLKSYMSKRIPIVQAQVQANVPAPRN